MRLSILLRDISFMVDLGCGKCVWAIHIFAILALVVRIFLHIGALTS